MLLRYYRVWGEGDNTITGSLRNKSEQKDQADEVRADLQSGKREKACLGSMGLPENQTREVTRARARPVCSILRSYSPKVLYFIGTLREVRYYKIIHAEEPWRNGKSPVFLP